MIRFILEFNYSIAGSGTTPAFNITCSIDDSSFRTWSNVTGAGGQQYSLTTQGYTVTSGSHTVSCDLDSSGQIAESDESNNNTTDGWTPQTQTLPDLTASANVANSYTPSQTGIQIPVTVSRAGANLPSTGYVHAKLYWSTNSTWDTGDQVLWSSNDSIPDFPTSTLNSNGSWTVNATINIPTSTPGTYYIIAYADAPQASYPSGYHEETNENNNTAVYAVTIGTGPDLTASANVANSYTPSQTGIQIPVTVSRAGANLPSTGYVHAKLYWSTNSTWDTGDQVLWSSNDSIPDFPTSTLNSNGSWTVNATINIPTSTPGTYYIIAYADAPQASYPSGYHEETNENNNTAVYAVTIIQATTPSTARFVPLHRAYSSNDSDHFYTTDPAQATPAYLQARGYTYEKIEAYISDRSFQGGVSLYRLYHSSGKSHYYTTNETEKDNAISQGFTYEGVVGYVYPNPAPDMIPMYHLYSASANDHFYTISKFERDNAVKNFGYADMGVAMYVARNASGSPLAGRPVAEMMGIDLSSGNFKPYYNHVDFANPAGKGIPFVFARTYNTMDAGYSGPMGPGWNHSYNISIAEFNGLAIVMWGDGRDDFYTVNGGTYTPDPGIYDTLTKSGSTYTLERKDLTKYYFESIEAGAARLTSIVDKNGNTVTLEYDTTHNLEQGGNLIMVKDGSGRYYQFHYTVIPQQITPGNRYRLEYILEQNTLARSITFGYDSKGNLARFRDAENNETLYEYDQYNRLTKVILPRKNTLTTTYDDQGRLKTQTVGNQNTAYTEKIAEITYDDPSDGTLVNMPSLGRVSSCLHADSQITSCKDGLFKAAEVLDRDANRNPRLIRDKNGKDWRYQYNSKGNILQSTNPNMETTRYEYDPSGINLTMIVDPANNVTTFDYDTKGNLKKVNKVVDGVTYSTDIERYPNGLVWTVTDWRRNTTTYVYDQNDYGYPSRIIEPLNKITILDYDVGGRLSSKTDADGVLTSFTYYKTNKVKSKTAAGKTTYYYYDVNGNISSIVDPRTVTKSYSYTEKDLLESITEAGIRVAKFEYDQKGRVKKVINAKNREWERTYHDPVDNLKTEKTPLGFVDNYTVYDDNGNLKTFTDRHNRTLNYDYDDSGRLRYVNLPSGQYFHEYHPDGLLRRVSGKGTINYFEAYNVWGKPKRYTDPFNNQITYTYDEAGNLKTMTLGTRTATYYYDARNLLERVQDWYANVIRYEYSLAGRLKKILYPNGAYIEYEYDAYGRLKTLNNRTSSGAIIAGYTVDVFDQVDNPRQVSTVGGMTPSIPAMDTSFTYDENNRLASGTNLSFAYNNQGEILTKTKSGITTVFEWDTEMPGRLKRVSKGSSDRFYSYDGLGNRISSVVNGVETRYANDLSGDMSRVLAETDGSGNVNAYYVYGLGLISRIQSDGKISYYHYDMSGNTVALTNSNGSVTDQYVYDGDPFAMSVTSQGDTKNPFTFVGRYGVMYEGDNLYFMRARYYDAELGRFLNEDPIGFESGDFNLYAYVRGNPITHTDPGGFSETSTADSTPMMVTNKDSRYWRIFKQSSKETVYFGCYVISLGNLCENRVGNDVKLGANLAKDVVALTPARVVMEPVDKTLEWTGRAIDFLSGNYGLEEGFWDLSKKATEVTIKDISGKEMPFGNTIFFLIEERFIK